MAAPPSGLKRPWLPRAFQALVLLLVGGFLAQTLWNHWKQLAPHAWKAQPGWLIAAGGIYALGLLPCAWFWRRVLQQWGYRVPWTGVLGAYYWGHLGKYVPGKALVVVLRTAALRAYRVPVAVGVLSVFYETLTMMAVGAAVAVLGLAVAGEAQLWLVALALGCALVALLPTWPPVFLPLARWAGKLSTGEEQTLQNHFGWPLLLQGWAAMFLCWVALGASLAGVLWALGTPWPADSLTAWARVIAASALAVVAGFLSLLPGGIAVRETVLVATLGPMLSPPQALVAAVWLRLLWLVSELGATIMLYVAPRWLSPGENDHAHHAT